MSLCPGRGMSVLNTSYEVTTCLSSHMTLFGGGFFVQPNSLDFDFIFAESDFSVRISLTFHNLNKEKYNSSEQHPDLRNHHPKLHALPNFPNMGKNKRSQVGVQSIELN